MSRDTFIAYQHRIHTEFRVCENILQVIFIWKVCDSLWSFGVPPPLFSRLGSSISLSWFSISYIIITQCGHILHSFIWIYIPLDFSSSFFCCLVSIWCSRFSLSLSVWFWLYNDKSSQSIGASFPFKLLPRCDSQFSSQTEFPSCAGTVAVLWFTLMLVGVRSSILIDIPQMHES